MSGMPVRAESRRILFDEAGDKKMTDTPRAKVLLVDDDEELTFVLSAHLSAAGYDTRADRTGEDGMATTASWRPDVVVMDVGLPGIDGIEATRRIKSNSETDSAAIIMLTARSDSQIVVTALEAGAQEYIVKPFDVAELLARIRTVYKLRQAQCEVDELNTRLQSEVESRTSRLRILYNFTRRLNAAESQAPILDLIIETIQRVTGSRRVSILLRDTDGEHLVCARATGIDQDVIDRIRVSTSDGIAGQVFGSGKTYVATALTDREHDGERYDTESFISTPLVATTLMTHEEKLGVLSITDKAGGGSFSGDEIECIRSIADSGAIALHNQIHRERLHGSVNVLLMTVGRLAEFRDNETSHHLERVSEYARILATEAQTVPIFQQIVTDAFVENIYRAAPMHDIGKVGVPDSILCKPGKLTEEEYETMKEHCRIGREVLESAVSQTGPVEILSLCVEIASSHHERFDGKGYPDGLAGDAIPLSARIIALVDAYDAITSKRRYKDSVSHKEAAEIIRSERGKHFDPDLVDLFKGCADQFDSARLRHAKLNESAGAESAYGGATALNAHSDGQA